MTSDMENRNANGGLATLLGAILSIGLPVVLNIVFAALMGDNPHLLYEMFMAFWFVMGFVWTIMLISTLGQPSSFRAKVSLTALTVCILAWLMNAARWAESVCAIT